MSSPYIQVPGAIPADDPPAPAVALDGARYGHRRAVAGRRARLGGLLIMASILCTILVGRLHELFPPLRFLPVGKLLLPLGLLLLIRQRDLASRLNALRTPQGIALIVYVATMALSVPTSMVQGESLSEFLAFVYGPVPFVVILACTPRSVDDIAVLMKALIVAMLCFGTAMMSGIGASYGDRLAGGDTYDPNDVAHIAVTCVPFAVFLLRDKSRLWRLIALGGLLMLMTIVMLSASRGGTIALALVVMALLLARSHLKVAWKVAMLVVVTVALVTAPPVFWERISTLTNMSSDYNINSESGRLEIWKRGVKVLIQHPITGVGLGQFATADGTFATRDGSADQSWHTAHNAPLQVGVEIGVIGLIAFFWLFIPTVRAARRARRLAEAGLIDPDLARQGDALRISLLGFGVGALFLSAGFSIITMTLTALGMAYSRLLRQASPRAQRVAPGKRARHRGSFTPLEEYPATAPALPNDP